VLVVFLCLVNTSEENYAGFISYKELSWYEVERMRQALSDLLTFWIPIFILSWFNES